MRLRYISLIAIAVLVGLVAWSSPSQALVLSQAQIDAIKGSCSDIDTNLHRLQQSDRLLRVNLGQNFDSISRRLMTPLNSRIALNGLDGLDLSKTTIDFGNKFTAFRDDYSKYADDLQAAIAIDCNGDPVGLYNAIQVARLSRAIVYQDTVDLHQLLEAYSSQLDVFQKQLTNGNTAGN